MKFKVKFVGSESSQANESFTLIVRKEFADVEFKAMTENVEVWLTEEQYNTIKGSSAFVVTDIDNELTIGPSAVAKFTVDGVTFLAPNETITHNLNTLAYQVVLTDAINYHIVSKTKDSFEIERLYIAEADVAKDTVGYVILK